MSELFVILNYKFKSDMERKVQQTFTSANILDVEVTHNGYQGGDAGHGGFVTIKLSDEGSTSMDTTVMFDYGTSVSQIHRTSNDGEGLIIEQPRSVTLTFRGDTERDTLVEALEFILRELKENEKV